MSEKKDLEKTATRTLTDDQVESTPDTTRRGALTALGVVALGAASKALSGCIVANPQPGGTVVAQPQTTTVVAQPAYQTTYQSGVTDGDSGSWSDPVNGGRGGFRGAYTGLTDGDSGRWSDPVNQGRGHR